MSQTKASLPEISKKALTPLNIFKQRLFWSFFGTESCSVFCSSTVYGTGKKLRSRISSFTVTIRGWYVPYLLFTETV